MSKDCTPFCESSCPGDHHPILKALMRCPEKELSTEQSAELQDFDKCLDQCLQLGWHKDMEIPEKDERFRFPTLHWAAVLGRLSAVKLLAVDRSADVKTQTAEGHTALHRVCLRMFESFQQKGIAHRARTKVKRLVEMLQYSLVVKDGQNLTPLLLACRSYSQSQGVVMNEFYSTLILSMGQVAKQLAPRFKDIAINSRNSNGDTALHLIAGFDMLSSCIGMLLSAGANPLLRNQRNQTAHDIAQSAGASRNAKQLLHASNTLATDPAHGEADQGKGVSLQSEPLGIADVATPDESSKCPSVQPKPSKSATPTRIPKLVINTKQGVITTRTQDLGEGNAAAVQGSGNSSLSLPVSQGKSQKASGAPLPPPLVPCNNAVGTNVSAMISSKAVAMESPPKLTVIENEKEKEVKDSQKVNGNGRKRSDDAQVKNKESPEGNGVTSRRKKTANYSKEEGFPQREPLIQIRSSSDSAFSSRFQLPEVHKAPIDQGSDFSQSRKRRANDEIRFTLNSPAKYHHRQPAVGKEAAAARFSSKAAKPSSSSPYEMLEVGNEVEAPSQSLLSLQKYVATAAAAMDESIGQAATSRSNTVEYDTRKEPGSFQSIGNDVLPVSSRLSFSQYGTVWTDRTEAMDAGNESGLNNGHASSQHNEEPEISKPLALDDFPEVDRFIQKLKDLQACSESADILDMLSDQEINRCHERMKEARRKYESASDDVHGLEVKQGIKVSLVHHLVKQLDGASETIEKYSQHHQECVYKVPRLQEKKKKLFGEYQTQNKVIQAHERLQVNLPVLFSAVTQRKDQVPDELVAQVDKASVTNQYQMMNGMSPKRLPGEQGTAGGFPLRQS
eukprot:m.8414 g.8414  ORF g.8414 m.8414 type:complete len:844 (+) comp20580_c0_seq2:100-2631(+)